MDTKKRKFVISVLAPDKVGILRDISSAIYFLGANIDGISQTVTAGYFTCILTITFEKAGSAETIKKELSKNLSHYDAQIIVKDHEPKLLRKNRRDHDTYIITAAGVDRKGILMTLTSYLAEKGINIEDWFFSFEGDNVTHIGEVSVPSILDIHQIKADLQERLNPVGFTVGFQHENIFRVTHEVGAVRPLIIGRSNA